MTYHIIWRDQDTGWFCVGAITLCHRHTRRTVCALLSRITERIL